MKVVPMNAKEPKPLSPGFAAFRERHQLSIRELSAALGGAAARMSRSTVDRLCRGEAEPRFIERCKPQIIESVTRYLEGKKLTPKQIQTELSSLFTEEVSMIIHRATLPKAAQKFFGLSRDPFTGDPRRVDEVFTSRELDALRDKVEDTINYQGFLVVTGDIGSGKTVLKNRVVDLVDASDGRMRLVWPYFLDMEEVSVSGIVSQILRDFDQVVPHDKLARANKLKQVLKHASEEGIRVALAFDECHRLNDKVLTALKNFWEMLGHRYTKYLGIVMFGQPQFEGRLRELKFREICERIEVVRMPTLTKRAADYLSHRLKVAGGELGALFEPKVVELIARTGATPLQLGNLANQCLLVAFEFGEGKVQVEMLKEKLPALFNDDEPRVRGVRRSGFAIAQ
jgi:type II secretory pathway predicted ATPase ExeA